MTETEIPTTFKTKWIAGFWRRLIALNLDFLMLAILGYVLGLIFENIFIQIGAWGRVIGFLIALSYFTLMNSNYFNGQTIAKRFLKIKVVDYQNNLLAINKSFARSAILTVPFFMNGAIFNQKIIDSLLIYPITMIVFGGFFSIIYLYVFNKLTRQSLHDLAIKTYVVNVEVEPQKVGQVWSKHFIIVALIFLITLVAPVFTSILNPKLDSKLTQSESYKNLAATQKAILNNQNVITATVYQGTNIFTPSDKNQASKTTSRIQIQAFIVTKDTSNVAFAKKLALTVLDNIPEAKSTDVIQITLARGYDIGIWSQSSNFTHTFKPSELLN